jgi:hypothetical protein
MAPTGSAPAEMTTKEGDVLEAIANSEFALWVNASAGWPIALTVHAFGTAVVVGLMFIIGLRLIGFFRTIPYTSLRKLIPLVWIAVILQAISGATLWTTKPEAYLRDGMFEVKFSLVIIACIIMGFFHVIIRREDASWEAAGTVSSRGHKLVIASCLLWAAVVIGGRLTAYLGSLYLQ